MIEMATLHEDNYNRKKVIIIGAGAAGLSAAHHLSTSGIKNIVVLEATDRIGGRVHTVRFGPGARNFVELGANLIHGGSVANPVYTHAISNNFFDSDGKIPAWNRFKMNNYSFLSSDGKILDPEVCRKAIVVFFQEEQTAAKIFTEKNGVKHQNVDLLTTLMKQLEKRLMNDFSENEMAMAERVFKGMLSYLRFHVGDELDKVSTKYYGAYVDMPGDDMIVTHGYQNLLKTLVEELPLNCIEFNHQVSVINWTPNRHPSPVSVRCINGTEWHADHVIVTSSLGYLKKNHRHLFMPNLPKEKINAVERIGYGCVNKIFLEFERPFWKGKNGNLNLTWNAEELGQMLNDMTTAWQTSIFSFNEVYRNPTVLVVWLGGQGAEQMEDLPDAIIAETCVTLLKRFTGNPTIPAIKKITRSAWKSNEFSQGSYSYCSTSSSPKDIEDLANPLPISNDPVVLFAGEATHSCYFSTVHGAFFSGIREANRIMQLNQTPKI